MNLFGIVNDDFFKPLAFKNKAVFADCIEIIYETYTHELSFGIEKEYIINKLISYFEVQAENLIFDDEETADNPRDKANAVLRRLKECGWIEYETTSDYKIITVLMDHSIPIIEVLHNIKRNREIEYEASIAAIYSILKNDDLYSKPYEYVIKEVYHKTKELINELKKLNTNIKKYIDKITIDKEAEEIIQMFFEYQSNIGSKAFMRIHTSENVSKFRGYILERLRYIRNTESLMQLAVAGYKKIEEEENDIEAENRIVSMLANVSQALEYSYNDIVHEITTKNEKYVQTAVARAKFKLANSNDIEGKLSVILQDISYAINKNDEDLNDYASHEMDMLFEVLPQNFIDNESLAVIPVTRTVSMPDEISMDMEALAKEREQIKQRIMQSQSHKFSRKNINLYVSDLLREKDSLIASEIPIETRRDMIRLIYVSLYGQYGKNSYRVLPLEKHVSIGQFRFRDFKIERR